MHFSNQNNVISPHCQGCPVLCKNGGFPIKSLAQVHGRLKKMAYILGLRAGKEQLGHYNLKSFYDVSLYPGDLKKVFSVFAGEVGMPKALYISSCRALGKLVFLICNFRILSISQGKYSRSN